MSLHAASICSCVARVPERRKRESGVDVGSPTSEVADAATSDAMLDAALRISETTGARSVEVRSVSVEVGSASASVDTASAEVKLSIADARLSTTEGRKATSVGKVALLLGAKVALRPIGAVSDRMHVDATIGIVSIVKVVMITSFVTKENSVGLGQASVTGAVGPVGSVEFPVGNGGVVVAFEDVDTPVVRMRVVVEKNPVRESVDSDTLNTDVVEFSDTGGIVDDAGGAVVEFEGTLGVGVRVVVLPVDEGGKRVVTLSVENDGTVE